MASTMRSSRSAPRAGLAAVLLLAFGALAACGALEQQKPGSLVVRGARIGASGAAAVLELGLDCRLSGPMSDALEHGIPITLQADVRAGSWPAPLAEATRRVELRYFPLSRRYQLREIGADDVRSFSTSAYLVAALGSLRLGLPPAFAALPPATPLRVSVRLDPAALPGALRLPALFEPAWHLVAADYAWSAAAR